MKEQRSIIRWAKEHKKELIIAGLSIAAVVATVLVIRNRAVLKAYWRTLAAVLKKSHPTRTAETITKTVETTSKTTQAAVKARTVCPHRVSGHIRTLPIGHHASPGKIAFASENGIDLLDGQTWIPDYWTGGMSA